MPRTQRLYSTATWPQNYLVVSLCITILAEVRYSQSLWHVYVTTELTSCVIIHHNPSWDQVQSESVACCVDGCRHCLMLYLPYKAKHMYTRGVWGHAPPENFLILDGLRLLLVHSQGLCSEQRIFNLEAIVSKGGGQIWSRRGECPPPKWTTGMIYILEYKRHASTVEPLYTGHHREPTFCPL